MMPLKDRSDSEEYTEEFLDRLEILWGQGFLSPGGNQEVAEIVRGIRLAGKRILDIGCGTGGAAIALVQAHRAGQVVGVDVERRVIDRAERNAAAAGIGNDVIFKRVAPGPLPFEDNSFDVVFSKDSIVHIAEKDALYAEVYRVLRPDGICAVSDWLAGENKESWPQWQGFLRLVNLSFTMATAKESEAAMRNAGLAYVSSRDRNDWYRDMAQQEVRDLEGPLRRRIIAIAGEESYHRWLKVRRALADAVTAGVLRPTHLRGQKI